MRNFINTDNLPSYPEKIWRALQDPTIKEIVHFCLGPVGTNIGQAAEKWTRENCLADKTRIVFCDTPEASLEAARKVDEDVLGVFWTCAVYFRLNVLFFENPDTLPFFLNYTMSLDAMQLATRLDKFGEMEGDVIPAEWTIASHPSPSPLMNGWKIIPVNSNTAAAEMCVDGKADACITTESGRSINGLIRIHGFGCPPMVFFGGITETGADLVRKAMRD